MLLIKLKKRVLRMEFEIENKVLKKYYQENGEAIVVIPENVISIGSRAFKDCKSLQSVIIPEGVTSIGNVAFSNCKSLQSVIIPKSVTSIGGRAFHNTPWLKNQRKKNLFVIVNGILIDGLTCKVDIIIPEGVTSISDFTFFGCSSLQSLVIPEGVTSIGDCAFWGCLNLQSVVIPKGITSIGDEAFGGCDSLQSVIIPGNAVNIGSYAFSKGIKIIFSHDDMKFPILLKNSWGGYVEEVNMAEFYTEPTFENFVKMKSASYKIPFALLRAYCYGEQEYKGYIKRSIIRVAQWIIYNEDYKLLEYILAGDFINKNNIDRIIQYAVDSQKNEMFVMLNNFKSENNLYKKDNFDI